MTTEQGFSLWLLLMGPVAGSFMTALADRTCSGQSFLTERSRCSACGQNIPFFDLIPLLSYVLLRGHCRSCSASIPSHVWFGELAGLGCGVIAIFAGNSVIEQGFLALFLLNLLGLFQTDRLCFRLPDSLNILLIASGVALGSMTYPLHYVFGSAVFGSGVFWGIATAYRKWRGQDGLGLGDVKMMAGISAAVGLMQLPWVTLLAALAALGISMLKHRGYSGEQTVPFGCYLAVATACVVIWP